MLITGVVLHVTRSNMLKNGGEVPGQGAFREMQSVGIHLMAYLVHSGEAPGQGTVGAS